MNKKHIISKVGILSIVALSIAGTIYYKIMKEKLEVKEM